MGIENRLRKIENAVDALPTPTRDEPADLSRLTPGERERLGALWPRRENLGDDEWRQQIRPLLLLILPPTAHGLHGTAGFSETCDCSVCEHWRLYHRVERRRLGRVAL